MTSLKIAAVIQARYASSRLPAKVLLDIGGKPMVVRVAERAASSGAQQVLIATDHPDIFAAVTEHGFQACMTRTDHPSGTDRIAEVAAQQGWSGDTIVVNVQGDEPLLAPALVARMAELLASRPDAAIATACHPIHDAAEAFNPNVVKVVLDRAGFALYFSRAPIPFPRQAEGAAALRHVGLYGYRRDTLLRLAALPPSPLERRESLEQLRALEHGIRIRVLPGALPSPAVDTPEDAARVARLIAEQTRERGS